MNYRVIFKYTGYILLIEGIFMFPAFLISLFRSEHSSYAAFALSIVICAAFGFALTRIKNRGEMQAREGFITVALGWIAMSLFGSLPFILSGSIPNFIDAWFETVSGFTTTGASILSEVESLAHGILYWRSFTHWLGGMGVLVFLLAVVPLTRGSGDTFHLLRAESPGPSVGKLTPTIRRTSRVLYGIYIALTVIEIILLLCGGMPLFEAVTNSFATAGTGGFAVTNLSIGAYNSAYLQMVIAIFMALFGTNFSIFYLLLLRQFRSVFKNEELRLYVGVMAAATVIIALNIMPMYPSAGKAFLDSFFQVSSIMTTTGFPP